MRPQDREYRCNVEVTELDVVGRSVVQRRISVLEERDKLRVQRAQHEQPARDIRGVARQLVDDRLQMRVELAQHFAAEVLELVECDHCAGSRQSPDRLREPEQRRRASEATCIDAERVHGVPHRGQDSGWPRIGDLHVQHTGGSHRR
jgi:hypothetical protein